MQCGQVAARQMVAQNQAGTQHGGTVINMSSVNAVMAIPTICSYNASKGGINNLTRRALLDPRRDQGNPGGPCKREDASGSAESSRRPLAIRYVRGSRFG